MDTMESDKPTSYCTCAKDDNDSLVSLDGVSINPEAIIWDLLHKIAIACWDDENDKAKSLLSTLTEETAHKLLSRSLDRCEEVSFNGTLLQFAIFTRNSEMIEYLVTLNGHDLEYEAPHDLGTPLIFACLFDDVPAAKQLLKCGVDPNHATNTTSPLINAVCYSAQGSVDMVNLLLENGAKLNVAPTNRHGGKTSLAFYLACLRGDILAAESFLSAIKDADESPVSLEQMVLCQTLLGIRLIQFSEPVHVQTGLSLWRKALVWFNTLMKPRFGVANKVQLSQSLLSLYMRESALVQTGQAAYVNVHELLERSLSRFPDFRLCVSPEDIGDDFQMGHDTVIVHETIILSCVSEMTEWWATHGLSLYTLIRNLRMASIPAEKKRLSLLLALENALHIGQSIQILSVNCNILMPTIIGCKLHVSNPGYLMLVMEIIVDAVQRTFASWTNAPARDNCNEHLDVMRNTYRNTAETMSELALLVLCNNPSSSQLSHLGKLTHRFIELCKSVERGKSSIHMEHAMLDVVLRYTLEDDPLALKDIDDSNDELDLTHHLLELFKSLLQCGINPNSRDRKGNTVMFTALKMSEPQRSDTIEMLIAHGAHVDITNNSGKSPYTLLKELKDCRIHPLSVRSLKCRAASTISYYKIPYHSVIPQVLEQFVVWHDTHTPTTL